jgi:hypothetical protein
MKHSHQSEKDKQSTMNTHCIAVDAARNEQNLRDLLNYIRGFRDAGGKIGTLCPQQIDEALVAGWQSLACYAIDAKKRARKEQAAFEL